MKRWSRKPRNSRVLHLLFVSGLLLAACGQQEPFDSGQAAYFLPPTLSNTAEAIQLVTPTPLPATATPQCMDDLEYVEDVTVPDGSAFAPGETVEKTWRVLNAGSCNWGPGYRLTFSGGELLGAPDDQTLFPARSGSEAEITILFSAPAQPGRYNSAWVAANPVGDVFGDVIFMDIIVDDTLTPTQAPVEDGSNE